MKTRKQNPADRTFAERIGQNITEARENLRLSAEDVAHKTGIPMHRLLDFELGMAFPSMQQLSRIACAVETEPGSLLAAPIVPKEEPEHAAETCRHAYPDIPNGWACDRQTGSSAPCTDEICKVCRQYKSRYIQYPIQVSSVRVNDLSPWYREDTGKPAAIRLAGDGDPRTYLGLYLGEMPWFQSVAYNEDSQALTVRAPTNPAIYVFELKRIVFGAESWWKIVESADELDEITDDVIGNQWYVRAMRGILAGKEDK